MVRATLAAGPELNPYLPFPNATPNPTPNPGVASPGGPSDVLLTNVRGEVTEASIANVLVNLGGPNARPDWVTPPLACGPCLSCRGLQRPVS